MKIATDKLTLFFDENHVLGDHMTMRYRGSDPKAALAGARKILKDEGIKVEVVDKGYEHEQVYLIGGELERRPCWMWELDSAVRL